jgi:hypothetical protein
LRQIKASEPRSRHDEPVNKTTVKTLGDKEKQIAAQCENPRSVFFRYFYQPVLKFLKSIAARIDLANFPGSCCG